MGVDIEAVKSHMMDLFKEVKRLREENAALKKENKKLIDNGVQSIEDEKNDFAFYIRSQREARGLSQGKFAHLVGTNSTTISNYEKGKGGIENMREIVNAIRNLGRFNL